MRRAARSDGAFLITTHPDQHTQHRAQSARRLRGCSERFSGRTPTWEHPTMLQRNTIIAVGGGVGGHSCNLSRPQAYPAHCSNTAYGSTRTRTPLKAGAHRTLRLQTMLMRLLLPTLLLPMKAASGNTGSFGRVAMLTAPCTKHRTAQ